MQQSARPALDEFVKFMTDNGHNVTSQRKQIAESFFELEGHHSLEEFYQHIGQKYPNIGQTTVYRTLKLLCDAGLADCIQFSDNITRYETACPKRHHDHLICLGCGKVVEICDSRIEALQKRIAEDNGFVLTGHSHNLYGFCPACSSKRN